MCVRQKMYWFIGSCPVIARTSGSDAVFQNILYLSCIWYTIPLPSNQVKISQLMIGLLAVMSSTKHGISANAVLMLLLNRSYDWCSWFSTSRDHETKLNIAWKSEVYVVWYSEFYNGYTSPGSNWVWDRRAYHGFPTFWVNCCSQARRDKITKIK